MADLDPRDSLPLPSEDSSIGAGPRGAHHGPGMGAEALEMAEIGSASATTTASTAVPGASTAGGQAAETAQRPPMTGEPRQRWRLVISRAPDAPLQTPGAWQAGWEQALAASALPILWTGSRRARPRFVPALPLPAGTAADRELADIFLANRLPRGTVREAIEHVAPTGHALVDCHDVWSARRACRRRWWLPSTRSSWPVPGPTKAAPPQRSLRSWPPIGSLVSVREATGISSTTCGP